MNNTIPPPGIKKISFSTFSELVRILQSEINASYANLPVRRLAEQITEGTAMDFEEKIFRVSRFVSEHTTFNRDPVRWEYLQTPSFLSRRLLGGEHVSGDCEDSTMLTLALLKSIGIPGYMVFVSPRPGVPYTHVFAVAEAPRSGRLLQMDHQGVGKVYGGPIVAIAA